MTPGTAPPARLLVLGIDAASPDLLLRWAADGTLPRIGSLLQRGLSGPSLGPAGFFIGSTWPSFTTGRSPAGHGIHYLVQLSPGTYRYHRPEQGEYLKAAPFWRALSAAGKRVAILDVPLSRLDPGLNGIQVVEWGGHDSLFGFRTAPALLARDIRQRYGAHPAPASCDAERRSASDYSALLDALVQGALRKGELTRELLRQGDWDLFMQVFTEAHCAGHQCWHLHDETHPAHDAAIAASLGDPLRKVYRAIDQALGTILDAAGDATVLLVVAHGMSHWYGAQFLLEEILQRLGAWYPAKGEAPRPAADSSALAAARWLWRRLPAPLRAGLGPARERLRRSESGSASLPAISLDPERSRCFPVGNGLAVGGIRLNQRGREPGGILAPGAETEAFCAELTADLLAIEDDRTGGPLIRNVLRTAELYRGPCLGDLPDLLVEWNDAVPTGSTAIGGGIAARVRAHSARIGVVEGENAYGRTGEHRREGLFIAAGPGIQPGRLDRRISLLDFAPTIGAMLGVPLPECEGVAVPELGGTAGLR